MTHSEISLSRRCLLHAQHLNSEETGVLEGCCTVVRECSFFGLLLKRFVRFSLCPNAESILVTVSWIVGAPQVVQW